MGKSDESSFEDEGEDHAEESEEEKPQQPEEAESVVTHKTEKEQLKKLQEACPFMTEEMYSSLQSLSRIHPFDSPNLIEHMIANPEQWVKFYAKTDGESVS